MIWYKYLQDDAIQMVLLGIEFFFFFWKSCFEPLSNKFTSDFCKESYKHINMSVKYGKNLLYNAVFYLHECKKKQKI